MAIFMCSIIRGMLFFPSHRSQGKAQDGLNLPMKAEVFQLVGIV
ncbi:unnamed protein product, partial [Vitis vinifera]